MYKQNFYISFLGALIGALGYWLISISMHNPDPNFMFLHAGNLMFSITPWIWIMYLRFPNAVLYNMEKVSGSYKTVLAVGIIIEGILMIGYIYLKFDMSLWGAYSWLIAQILSATIYIRNDVVSD